MKPETTALYEPARERLREADFAGDAEVSLLDVWAVIARRWRPVLGVTLLAMAVVAVIMLVIPATYTAQAVILPPQAEQSSQAMMMGSLAGLSGLSGLAGLAGGAGGAAGLLRNPAELYVGILKSRTIADDLIDKFQLDKLYRRSTRIDTRKTLARRTTITMGKDGLIYISVDDHDRARAAEMANLYVEELHRQGSRLALTSAGQRRMFFEQQLSGEKGALADAEVALKNMEQTSGLVYPAGQSEAAILSDAQLRAGIASREVQLQSMRLFAAESNPQAQMLESGLAAMRDQLAKIENGAQSAGSPAMPVRGLPAAGLEYARRLRDVKYHETLFELQSKLYEAARIDEARLAPVIQVVDEAVPPDKKSWPPRALFVLGAGVLAAFAASLFVLRQNRPVSGTA